MMKRLKLVIKGRGSWGLRPPLVFELIGGSRPYLWVGQLDKDGEPKYITALSPAMTRKLAEFLSGIE